MMRMMRGISREEYYKRYRRREVGLVISDE
jgi:hypothetical protein